VAPEEATNSKEIHKLFRLMHKYGASDLHLKAGTSPVFRISGALRNLELPPLNDSQVRKLLYDILTDDQIRTFEQVGDLDFAYSVDPETRLRINAYHQRGCVSVAARRVNVVIPTFEELNLPIETMQRISSLQQGMVIVAGVTGSGKSTTLAAMIEHINTARRCHIVTIEDPIEYLYQDKRALINQREVGIDVRSFREALRYVVRQDPDVILLGEMRDTETVQAGLSAAETGHLVFGTLHSSTAAQTFSRLLEFFPPDDQQRVRTSLQFNLRAIICQKLLPSVKPGVGRVPAVEIMLVTPHISKLIELGQEEHISEALQAGREQGMMDFNTSLFELIRDGFITRDVALAASPNPQALDAMLKGVFVKASTIR